MYGSSVENWSDLFPVHGMLRTASLGAMQLNPAGMPLPRLACFVCTAIFILGSTVSLERMVQQTGQEVWGR
jgi:hypothetical protein